MALNIQPFQFGYRPLSGNAPQPQAPVWGPPDVSKLAYEGLSSFLPNLAKAYSGAQEMTERVKAGNALEGINPAQQAAALGGAGGPYAPQPAQPTPSPAPKLPSFARVESNQPSANIAGLMESATANYKLNPQYLPQLVQIESKGDPNAFNSGSKASGLGQFVPGTWRQYGGGASPFDPAANIDATARLTVDNANTLRKGLGREPTMGELYLAHQQGAGGALALLRDPNARAFDVVPPKHVTSNLPKHLRSGASGMTAGQFAGLWTNRFDAQPGTMPQQAPAATAAAPQAPPSPAYSALGPQAMQMPAGPTGSAAPAQAPQQQQAPNPGAAPTSPQQQTPQRATPLFATPQQAAPVMTLPPEAAAGAPAGAVQAAPAPLATQAAPQAPISPPEAVQQAAAPIQPPAAPTAAAAPQAGAQPATPVQVAAAAAQVDPNYRRALAAAIRSGNPSVISGVIQGGQQLLGGADYQVFQGADGNTYRMNKRGGAPEMIVRGAPKAPETHTVGNVLYERQPDGTLKAAAGSPTQWRNMSPEEARAAGYPAGTVVQVNTATGEHKLPAKAGVDLKIEQTVERTEEVELAKDRAKRQIQTGDAARAAASRLNQIARMREVTQGLRTGAGATADMTVGKIAQMFGMSDETLKALGYPDRNQVAKAEMMQAFSGKMLSETLGSGEFPANNFSNADRDFLMSQYPNISNTPVGNAVALRALEMDAQRNIEKQRAWREYKNSNGGSKASFDDFEDRWSRHIEANPRKLIERPATVEERNKLPKGSLYIDPNGVVREKS